MAAEISYLLALASAEIDGYKFESWPVLLTEMVGCGWADLIRNSWLVQRDAGYWSQRESASRRVGIFVNPQECDFAYFLKAYTSFGVPVWIDWGPLINPYPACDLELQVTYTFQLPPKHIRPRTKALPHFAESTYDMIRGRWRRKFYDEALDLEWKKEDSLLFPQKVSHISSGSWDEVDEGKIQYEPSLSDSVSGVSTRQWLGETWMQFFSRLEKETELMMQHESPRDARRREARDRVAGMQSYPSKTANVFVWNLVDGKDYMVRCHVSSDQVSELWDFYTSTQRRYSSFWDEWDLNHEFDPSALSDVEEQEQIHGTDDTTGPSVGPELLRPVKNNRDAWEAAYMESFKPKLHGMVPNKRRCMTLEGVIRYRFGIVWVSVPSLGTTLTSVETVKAEKTLKLLGCHNAPRDELSSISSGVLLNLLPGLDWLQTLSTSDASSYTGQIPRDAWDISITCSDYLRPEHHNMTVTLVESWNESITGYEVQIKGGEEMPYKLILFRATDVMYISRLRGLPCLDDVVEDICSHGIRFLLALPISQDDADRCKARVFYPEPSLHRPYGFVPDMSEYKKYLWRRSTLFSDPAVVRAALMYGGLIGRIALDHVDDPSFVLSGFRDGISSGKGTIQWKPSTSWKESSETWVETLSESELDVICGVYKVCNTPGSSSSTHDLSWYPKMKVFHHSALDPGFWTADAERWYVARVKMYASGDPKATIQSSSEWKSIIRIWSGLPRLYTGLEIVSKRFLERHFIVH